MPKPMTAQPKPARISRVERRPLFPFGTIDIFYRLLREDGRSLPQERGVRVVLSSEECRQMSLHFDALAQEIDELTGESH